MSSRRDKYEPSINSGKRALENRLSENKERIRNLDKQLATMDALHLPTIPSVSFLRTFTNGKIHCTNAAERRSSSSSMENAVAFSGQQESRAIARKDGKEMRQERSYRDSRTRSRERRSPRSISRDRRKHSYSSYRDKRKSSRERRKERTDRDSISARKHPPEKRRRTNEVSCDRRSSESTASSLSITSSVSSKGEQRNHDDSIQVPNSWILPEPKDTLEHPTAYERLALERFEFFFGEVATILGTRVVCSRTYTFYGMQSVSIGFEKIPPEFLQGVCAAIEGFDKDTVDLRCYQLLVTHFVKMGLFHDDFPSFIYRYKSFGSFIANYLKPLCEKLLSQRASESFRSLGSGNVAVAVACFQELMRIESAAFWRAETRRIVDSFVSYQRSDYKEAVSRVNLDRPAAPKCVYINNSSSSMHTANGLRIGPQSLMNLNIPPPPIQLLPPMKLASLHSNPPQMPPSAHLYSSAIPHMVSHQVSVPSAQVAHPCTSSANGQEMHRDDFCRRTDNFLANLAERNREDVNRQREDRDRSDSPPPRFFVRSKNVMTSTSFGSPIPLPKRVSHNVPNIERNAFLSPTESVYIYPPTDSTINSLSSQPRKRNRTEEPDNDYDLVFS